MCYNVYVRFVYIVFFLCEKKKTFGSLSCVGTELVLYSVYYSPLFESITF